jgi:hypothetical protein
VLGSRKPYLIQTTLFFFCQSSSWILRALPAREHSAKSLLARWLSKSQQLWVELDVLRNFKMDVTSLLNANSVAGTGGAGDQKNNDGSRPIRNRTPWDAGGYSLPIMSSNPASTTPSCLPPQQPIHYDDSRMESPSTSHKFSDSRSSLSSFASSIQSSTHSRFSSTSTVSGCYPLNSWAAEVLSPKSTPTALDLASPSNSNDAPPSEVRPNPTTNEALDILSTIAERHITPELEQQERDERDNDCASSPTTTLPRPSSPSDAILIRRTTVPALRLDTTSSYGLSRPEPREM